MDTPTFPQVQALAERARAVDGVSPLDEQVLLRLKHGDDTGVQHLTRWDGDTLVGYGHLDASGRGDAVAKLVVDPDHRRQGIGRALVQQMVALAAPAPLSLWSHGRHPAASSLADSLGFSVARELWKMRRALEEPLPETPAAQGVTVRAFAPGDEQALLEVNAAAFADHPEQGAMSLTDLHQRMAEPWFDPAGLFMAWRDSSSSPELLGFHWTKVHSTDTAVPFGEVYVVGVSPAAQGLGLGRSLTLAGLQHLRKLGLSTVQLYVEGDNAPAIALYTRLGFQHFDTDVLYRHTP
ncbi:MAG TPA: mycothiol synthase [Nocardioidaceae bacterium]|nr:mycothiol synthase [Nocardioidaceae bacterium]